MLFISLSNETDCLVGTAKNRIETSVFQTDATNRAGVADDMDLD